MRTRRRFRIIHLLLAVPFFGLLWPPLYDRAEPQLAGIPFFYWYQLLWIFIGALVLVPVYLADERHASK